MTGAGSHRLARVGALLALCVVTHAAAAQTGGSSVAAGGEWERYLRIQQISGRAPLRLWTIRGFSDLELVPLSGRGNPEWDARQSGRVRTTGSVNWTVAPAEGGLVVNTAFPYGINDGPLWAGKGITAFGTGGFTARRGRVALSIRPYAFVAQNADFAIAPTGGTGPHAFANQAWPLNIDNPQRFGTSAYGRLDPGESTLRVDLGGLAGGLSTAAQYWGPAVENPLILGNNAPGFPHAFISTAHPISVGPFVMHSRIVWGMLKQSDYGPFEPGYKHFATGLVAAGGMKSLPGLEVGAARFFHMKWPENGILHADFLAPFEGILKSSLATNSNPTGNNPNDDQLASIFIRWAIPESRLELYAEYGREDHNWNVRDLALEPDHAAAYLLGFQHVWTPGTTRYTVLRGEILNARISHLTVGAHQVPWYIHAPMYTGHTERGQILGSEGAFGGGASVLALDRYGSAGRTTIRWDRTMRAELLENSTPYPDRADVMNSVRVERLRFGRRGDLLVTLGAVLDLNRNFGGDQLDFNSTMSYRLRR